MQNAQYLFTLAKYQKLSIYIVNKNHILIFFN